MRTVARVLFLTAAAVSAYAGPRSTGAIVLVNSQAPDYPDFGRWIEPYLKLFGVPYTVRDLATGGTLSGIGESALVIIGHRGIDAPRRFFTESDGVTLLSAIRGGTGLVSFDGMLAAWRGDKASPLYSWPLELFGLEFHKPASADRVEIRPHWISSLRSTPRTVALKTPLLAPGLAASPGIETVAAAGSEPLILAARLGSGRAVLVANYDWIRPDTKGRLFGLDDLVWRSVAWAARKPFVMRHVPKLLAMRVDDVSGFGIGANRHLGWMETANHYGLKPWVGVFIDDMRADPEALKRLAELTNKELATASVHARRWSSFFYLDEPLVTDDAKRNIAGRPWPDEKMAANWAEGEAFFREHGIAKSKVVLPHFYEFARNNFEGVKRWGGEFTGTVLEPGQGYGTNVPPFGPYLSGEPARASDSKQPIYIAGWLKTPEVTLFNFDVEIRDVTGYEWAPSGVPVEEAIRRGVEETRREFDSLVPGVLFTHESDHIRHIKPEDWDRILAGVMEQLKGENPVPVTLDYVCRYMRALATSRIEAAGESTVELAGSADIETRLYVYESDDAQREIFVPPFEGRRTVRIARPN